MVFSLTERERQVLVLIADGNSTKEAAATLGSATRRPIPTAAASWKSWAYTKPRAWYGTPSAPD